MAISSGETNVVTLQTRQSSRAQNEANMKERLAQLPPSLQLIFGLSQSHFKSTIQNLFDHVDDSLFELADRAESNLEQNVFFESMREIRIHRRDMEKTFLRNIAAHFVNVLSGRSSDVPSDLHDSDSLDIDDLSLVGNEELEELVAIDSLVKKAWLKNKSAIAALSARINSVVSLDLSERHSPLAPRSLADGFVDAASVLRIDIKAKLVLFKLFDRYVVQELPSVFKIVDHSLTEQGIAAPTSPRRPRAARADPYQNNSSQGNYDQGKSSSFNAGAQDNQPTNKGVGLRDNNSSAPNAQALYDTLQSLLHVEPSQTQARADFSNASSYANNSSNNSSHNYALTEVSLALINALSQIQQQQVQQIPSLGAVQSSEAQPTLLSTSHLKTAIQSTGGELLVDERSQDVMKLVDMLFSFILEDKNLPDPIKLLLARLQIPFIKVALADEDFFKKEGHPARRLLNEMAVASIGWTCDVGAEKRDTLLIKIESTVSRILKDFDTNFELFTLLLTDFIAFMEKERRRVLLFEKRAIDAEAGKAKSEIGRKEVDKKLANLIHDKDIPNIFKEFIVGPWANILFLIYMRQGLDSKQWSNALNIASELVWSALPIEDDTHKIKLSMLLPRLGNALKKSLESISFNPARQTQFVELFHEHYSLLFKNYRQKPFIESSLNATADTIINSHAVDKKAGLNHKNLTDNNVEARVAANSTGAQALLAKADKGAEVINSAVLESRSSTSDSSNTKPFAEVDDASQTQATGKAQTADTQYINLVDNFTVGVWFEKKDDDIVSYRCRLAAIIRGTSKYIFVNRAGVKVAEETRVTLAVLLQQGKLRTLDDGMLFDRALESVITNLRTPK
jgi:hypothetical protein